MPTRMPKNALHKHMLTHTHTSHTQIHNAEWVRTACLPLDAMVLDMEEKEAEAKELLLREQVQQQAEVCCFSCALLLLVCAGAGYFSRVRQLLI